MSTQPDSHKVFQDIWQRVSQPANDGNRYIFFKSLTDIEYLYCTGFVDEEVYSVKQWVESFNDSRQPDGSYVINEIEWMDKIPFRHVKPVGSPFDVMTLKEGDWSEEDMQKLIQTTLLPNLFFTKDEFSQIFALAKQNGLYVNGKYRITPLIKRDIHQMLTQYPSPRRARELAMQEAKKAQAPAGAANTSGTGFQKGIPASQQAAMRLQDLISKKR
ncbi:MAG: hypothetical protein IPJ69_14920 [Deltaproteobacteria bacterium]|nr:MAG: hypothetical protein IPJ69_14920 [Deltaproteobacteria bacterium]